MFTPEQHSALDIASQQAYEIIGDELGIKVDEVHREGVCHGVSKFIVDRLIEIFPSARCETRGSSAVDSHCYVELSHDGGEGNIVADATWQQFISPEAQNLGAPKVLVGQRKDVIATLRAYGVSDSTISEFWETKK